MNVLAPQSPLPPNVTTSETFLANVYEIADDFPFAGIEYCNLSPDWCPTTTMPNKDSVANYIEFILTQSYFMPMFFLISGLNVPRSRERKGVFMFVRDKLLRLMVPTMSIYFIINPLYDLTLQDYRGQEEFTYNTSLVVTW